MKILRKIFLYTILTLAVLLVSSTVSVFLFKERILNQFIREANKNLNTPVKLGKIDISVFQSFPQLSIVLNDVYIEDSHEGQYPLLTAAEVSFQLSPIQVWKGNYTIEGLKIRNSETNLKINQSGKNNYTVLKAATTKSSDVSTVKFELKNVSLKSTRVNYIDVTSNQHLVFSSDDLLASIHSASDVYDIQAEGSLTTERISVDKQEFLTGKKFEVESVLSYDDLQKVLVIKPSTLRVRNSSFSVEGNYKWKGKNAIDITTEGKDTDVQTLLSLLTDPVAKKFERYRSKGDVYLKARLVGEISRKVSPSISINFGFNDATLFNPDSRSEIRGASMEGSFTSSQLLDIEKAVLQLKNIKGDLNGEPFTASFRLRDFKDPDVACAFNGKVDAASILDFYPVENVNKVTGSLLANVKFEGKVGLLKKRATAQRVSTEGSIELNDIGLLYDNIGLQHLSGNMQFNNNDLALSNVSGQIGNSDFMLNGFFKNIITFLLFENQPIGIETDLKSNFLDVDQLLVIGFGKNGKEKADSKKQQYEFKISKNINLNFNCDVKALRFRRFHATQLQGDLLVKNEMAVSRKIRFNSMGGDMTFSGIVDAKNNKAIDVVSTFKLSGIHADSMFYVFENFDQNFIVDKHLKGQVFADVSLELALNQNLRLFQETLVSDITMYIKNGELNNFEPMKKLNKYLNDEGLSKLRFSDIKNDIHIENKTVYIPQMEVRTNVTSIKVSGTHTFQQRIDYRIIAPLRNNKNINYVEAKEALQEDGAGQSKLFLKLIGTADDYRVVYDTESVKKKIATDLKQEVQELKEAFKNKGTKEKKEVELQDDEYFDW